MGVKRIRVIKWVLYESKFNRLIDWIQGSVFMSRFNIEGIENATSFLTKKDAMDFIKREDVKKSLIGYKVSIQKVEILLNISE